MSQDQSVNEYYEQRFRQLERRVWELSRDQASRNNEPVPRPFHVEQAIAHGVIHGPVSSGEEFAAAVFLGVPFDKANAFLTAFAKGRGIL
jgi:hypothetical protein